MAASEIRRTVDAYLTRHPDDAPPLALVGELLADGADLTDRSEFRGHATAGAILVHTDGRVLLVHHRTLDRWLLPGGHLEPSDASLLDAALRELAEETGVPTAAVRPLGADPVHIDVHPIPANPGKDEPAHRHIDFRFLFETDVDELHLQEDEVTDAEWRTVSDLRSGLALRVTETLRRRGRGDGRAATG